MSSNEPASKTDLQELIWRMRADIEDLVARTGPERMELPGAMGDWTMKDAIAHLTAWRWRSVARLEAAAGIDLPNPSWDSSDIGQEDESQIDQINDRLYQQSRNKPVINVLSESRTSFDRLEAALLALSEEELFERGRYPWLDDYPLAAVISGASGHLIEHLHDDRGEGLIPYIDRLDQEG